MESSSAFCFWRRRNMLHWQSSSCPMGNWSPQRRLKVWTSSEETGLTWLVMQEGNFGTFICCWSDYFMLPNAFKLAPCRFVIHEILSCKARDQILDNIHSYLCNLKNEVMEDEIQLDKMTITKVSLCIRSILKLVVCSPCYAGYLENSSKIFYIMLLFGDLFWE